MLIQGKLVVLLNVRKLCVAVGICALASISVGCASNSELQETEANSPAKLVSDAVDLSTLENRWLVGENAEEHYSRSCPSGTPYVKPESINLHAQPVDLLNVNSPEAMPVEFIKSANLNGLEYVAGYHLTSDNPRFGGISGLDTLDDGSLLSVTDQGDFLWIGMDEFDHLLPVSAQMSVMRDADGVPYDSKRAADSEGLAVSDGLALVSFEQNHRVEAFDLTTCGSNARASRIFDFESENFEFKKSYTNKGMEALALTRDGGLILGLEALNGDASQISISPKQSFVDFKHEIIAGGGKQMTGSDFLSLNESEGLLFSLHRHYSPLTGTHIRLLQTSVSIGENDEFSLANTQELLYLKPPGISDNFEGIAVRREENGVIRLFIVSDDNFSPKQRSLLLIFNVLPKAY